MWTSSCPIQNDRTGLGCFCWSDMRPTAYAYQKGTDGWLSNPHYRAFAWLFVDSCQGFLSSGCIHFLVYVKVGVPKEKNSLHRMFFYAQYIYHMKRLHSVLIIPSKTGWLFTFTLHSLCTYVASHSINSWPLIALFNCTQFAPYLTHSRLLAL